MSFVLLGDVMVDVTARIDESINVTSDTRAQISLQTGGAAANTAGWLAHLGEQATLIGSIGADPFGESVLAHLDRLGVVARLQRSADRPTGICVVIVDAHAERTMLPDPAANASFAAGSVPAGTWHAGGHFHLSGYTLLNPDTRDAGLAALRDARAAGMTCSLDPASAAPLARDQGAFDRAWDALDIVLANAAEAHVLTGLGDPHAALAALAERVPWAVVKRGHDGALGRHGSQVASAPAPAVAVVDSTGAGDAFAAGFLASWVRGDPLAACLGEGCRTGGLAVARVGAAPP